MINDYCGMCDSLLETLLDTFQMKDWNMSWSEFISQAQKEINVKCEKWKTEDAE